MISTQSCLLSTIVCLLLCCRTVDKITLYEGKQGLYSGAKLLFCLKNLENELYVRNYKYIEFGAMLLFSDFVDSRPVVLIFSLPRLP